MNGEITTTPEVARLALIAPEQAYETLRQTSITAYDGDDPIPNTLRPIIRGFEDTEEPELRREQAVEAFLELAREGEVPEDELRTVAFPNESDLNTPGLVEGDVIDSLHHFPGVKRRANGLVWRIDPVEANILIREANRTDDDGGRR